MTMLSGCRWRAGDPAWSKSARCSRTPFLIPLSSRRFSPSPRLRRSRSPLPAPRSHSRFLAGGPTPGEAVLPPGVLREGVYLTAPVVLDGATLFRVATPLLSTPDEMPVDVRADYVNEALAQIVRSTRQTQDAVLAR